LVPARPAGGGWQVTPTPASRSRAEPRGAGLIECAACFTGGMFRYTALRFGLVVASFGVIWGLVRLRVLPAGLGDSNYLWVALLALVVSAPLSWVLLRGAREQAAVVVSEKVERTRRNLAANAGQEDEADDARREPHTA
jgi:hypothetical protein